MSIKPSKFSNMSGRYERSLPDLRYNIESRRLKGKMRRLQVDCYAGSGGRAGSTKVDENILLANNSLATHIGGSSSEGTHIFGPIPRGRYTLKLYPKERNDRKNWIKLVPHKGNIMGGRSGFAIHGRGKIGSHGCIVPDKGSVIKDMIGQLKKYPQEKFTLEVVSIGSEIGWQNRLA